MKILLRSHRSKSARLQRGFPFHVRCFAIAVLVGIVFAVDASLTSAPAAGADLLVPGQRIQLDPGQRIRLDIVQSQGRQTGQAGISSPSPNSSVVGSVPILGTASGAQFARYELYYKMEPSGDDAYKYFGGETRQIHNGQLGVWDTLALGLAPGVYTLRMRVVRPDGNYNEYFAPNISVNQEVNTPTPDGPTPTPIPVETPTPRPQPTVAPVRVQQPELDEPSAEPTATPLPPGQDNTGGTSGGGDAGASQSTIEQAPTNIIGDLGALSLTGLRESFFTGVRWSAGLFLLLGALFAAKRLIEWALSKVE